MICGIYQIINTVNNKSYVGQSRNIKKRWMQHTSGLNKPSLLNRGSYPLRAAFLKYGLNKVVSTAGRVGKFEFKILEECGEAQLLEQEQYWIDKIKPEYNCNIWTPARKRYREKAEPKFWVQYHNYDKLGYLPAEEMLDEYGDDEEYGNPLSCVSTTKRSVLNAQGDTIFLIVGLGQAPKQYYLWSRKVVEEVEITDQEGSFSYDAFGDGWLLDPPQRLNSLAFNEFKKFCGNFGLGFTSIDNSPYLHTLKELSEVHKPQSFNINFLKYVESFYAQVCNVNPKVDMPIRLVRRSLAVSLCQFDAALYLEKMNNTLVMFEIHDRLLAYRGKLFIHVIELENEPVELRDNFQNLLTVLELREADFPVNTILGCVTVKDVFKYDPISFAADLDAHGLGDDLLTYQAECSMVERDAWGIRVGNPFYLEPPVNDVMLPNNINDGDIWFPKEPFYIKAFRLALQYEVEAHC